MKNIILVLMLMKTTNILIMIFVNKDIILLNKEYCGDVAFVMKKSPSENERYVTTCTCGTPRPEKKIVKNSCTDEE